MSVDTNVGATTNLFGKTVGELQENVVISTNSIAGHFFYQGEDDPYTGFWPSNPEMQLGNFIAIHCNVPDMSVSQYSISVKITDPVTLDPDGIFVGRIADKNSQTITVVASDGVHEDVTKVYSLSSLTCDSE